MLTLTRPELSLTAPGLAETNVSVLLLKQEVKSKVKAKTEQPIGQLERDRREVCPVTLWVSRCLLQKLSAGSLSDGYMAVEFRGVRVSTWHSELRLDTFEKLPVILLELPLRQKEARNQKFQKFKTPQTNPPLAKRYRASKRKDPEF